MKTSMTREVSLTLNVDEAQKVLNALTVQKGNINYDFYRNEGNALVRKLEEFLGKDGHRV